MRTFFVADMHLLPGVHPEQEAALRRFLFEVLRSGDRVILLGDVFHFWYERGGEHLGAYDSSLRLFREAVERGVRVEMIRGNRDFTAGPHLVHLTGIHLLGDQLLLQLGEDLVVVAHGDAFCTRDRRYQMMRRFFVGSAGRLLVRIMPFWLIGPVVRAVQARSARISCQAPAGIADIQVNEVLALLDRTGATLCICGHIHFARDTRLRGGKGGDRRLIVVAPWGENGQLLVNEDGVYATLCSQSPVSAGTEENRRVE